MFNDKGIEDLTEEEKGQLLTLLNKQQDDNPGAAAPGTVQTPTTPPVISMTLPDGRPFTGTQEQLQTELNTMQQPQQNYQQTNQPQTAAPLKFNEDEFKHRLESQGLEAAMNYRDEASYGFKPGEVVPHLVNALQGLALQQNELLAKSFIGDNPNFHPSPKNMQTLNEFIDSRGWQRTPQSYSDALSLAGNTLESKPVAQAANLGQNQTVDPSQTTLPFNGLPPVVQGSSYPEDVNNPLPQDIFAATANLDTDQLGEKINELEAMQGAQR